MYSARKSSIASFLVDRVDYIMPAIIFYFGITSYCINKLQIAELFVKSGKLNLEIEEKNIEVYVRQNAHLEMSKNKKYLNDDKLDVDYLMQYHIFFQPGDKNLKVNYYLIAYIRVCLYLDFKDKIIKIHSISKLQDRQVIIDTIALFGSCRQISDLAVIFNKMQVQQMIIMELLCYNKISKIGTLYKLNVITIDDQLYNTVITIADKTLINFVKLLAEKNSIELNVRFKIVIGSRSSEMIKEFICGDQFKNYLKNSSKKEIRNDFIDICKLNRSDLVKTYLQFNGKTVNKIAESIIDILKEFNLTWKFDTY